MAACRLFTEQNDALEQPLLYSGTDELNSSQSPIDTDCEIGTGIDCDSVELENNGWNWDLIDEHVHISSDSKNEHNSENISLFQQLVAWVDHLAVKHNAVEELLKILSPRCPVPSRSN